MNLDKPDINPTFFYGPVVSYRFNGDISKDKGKYRIRFTLYFKSGNEYTTQKSGFTTESEARRAKEVLITQLEKREYISFDYTAKEFFNFWLYYYMIEKKKIRYDTFQNYHNILYNYFLPAFGTDKKLKAITAKDIENTVSSITSTSLKKSCIAAIKQIFGFACSMNFLTFNPSILSARNLKKELPEKRATRNVEPYTVTEIRNLLFTCKQNFRDMYIPLLLAITTGTRISETLGLKYSDIDFNSLTVYVKRQLGRDINDIGQKGLTTKEIKTKTANGIRAIPLAKWVADELIVRRAWYENQKNFIPNFQDRDYICCHCDGKPFYRNYFTNDFHTLINMCGLRQIRWHDLRHMYASVLKHNEVNMKAISEYIGHYSPDFTDEVYVYQEECVYDCSLLTEVWEEVRPRTEADVIPEAVFIPITDEDYKSFFINNVP